MPLSEQEQRLLEEMERSLYQNDADFVPTTGQRRGRPNYTVLVIGALLGLLGVGTLVVGVIVRQPFVGILGFAIMFVGVLLAVAPPRRLASPEATRPTSGPSSRGNRPANSESFMDRLNERWDKRQDGRE
jgi:Protein of unknown function (DUF3040)